MIVGIRSLRSKERNGAQNSLFVFPLLFFMIKRSISLLVLLGGACLGAGFLATQVSAAVKPVQKSLPRVASCSALARTIKSVQSNAKDASYFRGACRD
jgi:hypothetical protein